MILIADDDPADVELTKHVIRKANVLNEVHSVRDGAEAIAYLSGDGIYRDRSRYPYPEILLLDLRMPKVSGMEVLEWIRARPEHREVGIIVLSALEYIREVTRAYQLGAHSFLVKPLRLEEFLNLLSGLKGIRLKPEGEGRYLDFDTSFMTNPSLPEALEE